MIIQGWNGIEFAKPLARTRDVELFLRAARALARREICSYMNVPVYKAYQKWLGRGPLFEDMWSLWDAGDRKGALAAIPDEAVDALVVTGGPEERRAHIQRYVDNGIETPVLMALPLSDTRKLARELAPGTDRS